MFCTFDMACFVVVLLLHKVLSRKLEVIATEMRTVPGSYSIEPADKQAVLVEVRRLTAKVGP